MTANDHQPETRGFISHPNQRTLHRGTRDEGAECGAYADSWAKVDAADPLDAVVNYATPPCTRCFDRAGRLIPIYKKLHSAVVIRRDMDELVRPLPWSLDESETAPKAEDTDG